MFSLITEPPLYTSLKNGTRLIISITFSCAREKVYRDYREVPHYLKKNQVQRRVGTYQNLLQNPHDKHFIPRIVTWV